MIKIKPIVVIPHYNHASTLKKVVQDIRTLDLPIIIVDDGSSTQNIAMIKPLESLNGVNIVYRHQNGGKGAAMKTGFQVALAQHFTHAIQVDADGQHNLNDITVLLQTAENHPDALICGNPIYDESAPRSRLYGRKITNFWIAINTLSLDIQDGMCGFRVYPLEEMVSLLNDYTIGDRMDFDIDILVHAHWQKIPMLWVNTQVKYEKNGVSHFRGFSDNWLISKMHARLFFSMLWRIITGKSV